MGEIKELVFIDIETTALLGPDSNADAIIETLRSHAGGLHISRMKLQLINLSMA